MVVFTRQDRGNVGINARDVHPSIVHGLKQLGRPENGVGLLSVELQLKFLAEAREVVQSLPSNFTETWVSA
jgi:hypothetical protein